MKTLQDRETELREKHADVIEDSILRVKAGSSDPEHQRLVPKGEKITVQRPCKSCGETFRLNTSDLHQTFSCFGECRDQARKDRSKAAREAKKAEKEALEAEVTELRQVG